MSNLLLIVIPLVFILSFYLLKKRLRILIVFLISLSLIASLLIVDTKKAEKTISHLRHWIKEPVIKTYSYTVEEFHELPIIKIKENVLLDAPTLSQYPELPRGCEVTSLAMLLQSADIKVDKLTLAKKIKKDPTPYRIEKGKTFFGHPNEGFVGNMYTNHEPGLGVYHGPIRQLAENYLPGRIKDFTGSDFQEVKIHLSDNRPVWVITNTRYQKLSADSFITWETPKGQIQVTYREHSVLLTGFDKEFIYFNDPLTGEKNKKAPIKDFEESWVQMGRQAITYLPKN